MVNHAFKNMSLPWNLEVDASVCLLRVRRKNEEIMDKFPR
jgi:hypothetical protein